MRPTSTRSSSPAVARTSALGTRSAADRVGRARRSARRRTAGHPRNAAGDRPWSGPRAARRGLDRQGPDRPRGGRRRAGATRGRRWEGTWAAHRPRSLPRPLRTSASMRAGSPPLPAPSATRLGSPPLIAAADEVLDQAGRRGAPAEPWAPLTAREYEVARLVAEGLTNPAIAAGARRRAEDRGGARRAHPRQARRRPARRDRGLGGVGRRATLPPSRRRPGGVAPHTATKRARDGASRAGTEA